MLESLQSLELAYEILKNPNAPAKKLKEGIRSLVEVCNKFNHLVKTVKEGLDKADKQNETYDDAKRQEEADSNGVLIFSNNDSAQD